MQISEDTSSFVAFLNEYSKDSLRKVNDVEVIFELGASFGLFDEMNKILLSAKSLWNLTSKLKSLSSNSQGIELIQNEIEKTVEFMKENLKVYINNSDQETISRFNSIYFEMTKGCLLNLIDLSHDLSIFKDLQNQRSRN